MGDSTCEKEITDSTSLEKRDVSGGLEEYPFQLLSSVYDPVEHKIRDISTVAGHKIVTFASLLKHRMIPFSEIVDTLLSLGKVKLGCPVEIEFAVDFGTDANSKALFPVLQIRPMSAREEMLEVEITEYDFAQAFCVSENGLGNTVNSELTDIIYVKPESFEPAKNKQIALEISKINSALLQEGRKYILFGPGRWGSADHWLGIPVNWEDISRG